MSELSPFQEYLVNVVNTAGEVGRVHFFIGLNRYGGTQTECEAQAKQLVDTGRVALAQLKPALAMMLRL